MSTLWTNSTLQLFLRWFHITHKMQKPVIVRNRVVLQRGSILYVLLSRRICVILLQRYVDYKQAFFHAEDVCHPVAKENCHVVYKEECHPVQSEECKTKHEEECHTEVSYFQVNSSDSKSTKNNIEPLSVVHKADEQCNGGASFSFWPCNKMLLPPLRFQQRQSLPLGKIEPKAKASRYSYSSRVYF